jgi:hypothetical protein
MGPTAGLQDRDGTAQSLQLKRLEADAHVIALGPRLEAFIVKSAA